MDGKWMDGWEGWDGRVWVGFFVRVGLMGWSVFVLDNLFIYLYTLQYIGDYELFT